MQKLVGESGQVSYDEVTGLPLHPKLVADAIKEELMFMRKPQVYHEVPVSHLDKSGLKAIAKTDGSTRTRVMLRIHSSEQDCLRKKPRE